MPKEEEEKSITMTVDEFNAAVDKRVADAKMSPDEKKLRKIIREEAGQSLKEQLADLFRKDDDDEGSDEDSGGENDGGETDGLLGNIMKFAKGS